MCIYANSIRGIKSHSIITIPIFLSVFLLFSAILSCKHDISDLLNDKKPTAGPSTSGGGGGGKVNGGVVVTQSGGNTTATEGGAGDNYTVVLTTQPTANVTITINAGTQVTVTPSTLTFTAGACPGAGNWCLAQTVTVAAVDNAIADGTHTGTITHTAQSTDTAYNGISISNVTVTITDNDSAGVSITQSGGSTTATEGGSGDTYTVVLTFAPTANVTITLNPGTQVTAIPSPLTFTTGACPGPGNWCTAQTVTVAAVDDAVVEVPHTGTITHTAASGDAGYNGIAIGNVTVNIIDNDGAPIYLFKSTLEVNGALGGRVGADVTCTTARAAITFPTNTCSTARLTENRILYVWLLF